MRRALASIAMTLALAAPQSARPAQAQHDPNVDEIRVGRPLPRFDRLRAGTRRYLRYVVAGERRSGVDIWTRTLSFEPDPATGQRRLHIVQSWHGARQVTQRDLDSWFEEGTFRPISHHTRNAAADGAVTIAAVRFAPDRVRGDAAVADNSLAALDLATATPTFNFETDMEMLATLPWRDGYSARINFYHPGGRAPQDYVIRAAGSETLSLGGRPIDCWVAVLDYGSSVSRFWIDKDTQTVLKVESRGPDLPGILYKVLLPPE